MKRLLSLALRAALLLAALAGCQTTQQGRSESATPEALLQPLPPPGTPARPAPPQAPPVPAPPQNLSAYPRSIQDQRSLPAVLSFYRQAQAERAAGHPDLAKAALDRALHLDPRNPFIWQALAGAELDLKDPDQAEQAAQKSNSLAHGNPYIESGNWRLIASARQALGDSGGALDAQARADGFDRMLAPGQ